LIVHRIHHQLRVDRVIPLQGPDCHTHIDGKMWSKFCWYEAVEAPVFILLVRDFWTPQIPNMARAIETKLATLLNPDYRLISPDDVDSLYLDSLITLCMLCVDQVVDLLQEVCKQNEFQSWYNTHGGQDGRSCMG
jgi:hypothetical protein